ncbi:low molecular weight protein-tyrosine-phosphatase [Ideonella livida]|uniref:protein-tyrosine-phosphatase n=1 Tax=Ideonella livida TaxID=2707176 RepID=A0A7C9TM52_9BURK|nr:low molecular weight protein-tyrosine-phosphatase [Ideonella livida]NDY91406.1 low molecular weight phosphotyrosine protein phosphatase [Ideonella livida]
MVRRPDARRTPGGVCRVCFVCTGNICRSPTAEAVLRALAERQGLGDRFEVDSAGTGAWHVDEPPDARSQHHAAARGWALQGLRARQLRPEDFHRFDWLIALDRSHLAALRRLAPPGSRARLSLLMDFADGPAGREVPDPYYDGPQRFEQVLDLVEEACQGLLRRLA